jgi:hypothetical protein
MIDIDDVIALIIAGTGLSSTQVVRAKETEDNLLPHIVLPMVYVGFATIESKNPNAPIEHNVFNTYGEDLVQSFDIVLACDETTLAANWRMLYKSLIGKNPTPTERLHTGLTYSQGGKMRISNGKIWHIDRWRLGFPTLFTNFN